MKNPCPFLPPICEGLHIQPCCQNCPDTLLSAMEKIPFSRKDGEEIKAVVLTLPHVDPSFSCPHTGMPLLTYCLATSCGWWVPFPASGHCLLSFLSKHKKEDLKENEISILLGEDVSHIQEEMALALRALRGQVMETELDLSELRDKNYQEPDNETCAVCHKKVLFAGRKAGGFLYCGDACYETKPPMVLQIEVRYHASLEVLMEKVQLRFKDPYAALQVLGLPYSAWYKLLARGETIKGNNPDLA